MRESYQNYKPNRSYATTIIYCTLILRSCVPYPAIVCGASYPARCAAQYDRGLGGSTAVAVYNIKYNSRRRRPKTALSFDFISPP